MDLSGAVDLDESPDAPSDLTSLESPSSPPRPRMSLFYGGTEEEDQEEESLPGEEGDADASDSAHQLAEQFGDLDGSGPPSWTASPAGEKPAQLLSKRQLRQTGRAAVMIGTGMAHTVAAKTEAQQRIGLYLADADDAANIADPLADIAYRRGDVVGGKLSPDANDFLRSLMGVAGYLAKQINKIGQLRAAEVAVAEPQQFGQVA